MGWIRGLAGLPGRLMGPAAPAPAPEPLPGPPSPVAAEAPLALGPPTPAVQPDALMTLEEFVEGLIATAGVPNRVAIDILKLLDGSPQIWTVFYRWMFDGGIIIRTWQNFIDAWDAYNGGRPRDPRDGPDGGPDGGPGGGPGGFYDPRGPGGPGGDPGAGPSGPGGGPPSGPDRPDELPERSGDGDGGDTAAAAAVQEDLVDDTVFDPTYSDIMDSFIRRLNYNPHYSRMGGIGSVVKAERPDLKTLKIWYALLFSDSDEVKRAVNFNLDNIKRIYGTLTVAQKQRLLDDFNGRLKRHSRSGPVFFFRPASTSTTWSGCVSRCCQFRIQGS